MHSTKNQGKVECAAGTICRHHWMVESTDAEVAKGVCRLCGEERTFENGFHRARPPLKHSDKPASSVDDSPDLDLQEKELLPGFSHSSTV